MEEEDDFEKWEGLQVVRRIGRGAQGCVYLCKTSDEFRESKGMPDEVVVKTVFVSECGEKELKAAMSEVTILSNLSHPHIIKYFHYFLDPLGYLCTVMEYAHCGDLSTVIREHQQDGTPLPTEVVMDSALQLLDALSYLQTCRVLHRDLKPANILISAGGLLRITDFGVSRLLDQDQLGASTFAGTPHYICPELCLGESYGFGGDVWSLGVSVYELAALELPFKGNNILAVVNAITDGTYPPLKDRPPEVVEMVADMLTADPTERPSAIAVLAKYFPKHADHYTDYSDTTIEETHEANLSLPWMTSMCYEDSYQQLQQKLREKAVALQRKRNMLRQKKLKQMLAQEEEEEKRLKEVERKMCPLDKEALAEEGQCEGGPPGETIITPPEKIKARFLQTVTYRAKKEGRRVGLPQDHEDDDDDSNAGLSASTKRDVMTVLSRSGKHGELSAAIGSVRRLLLEIEEKEEVEEEEEGEEVEEGEEAEEAEEAPEEEGEEEEEEGEEEEEAVVEEVAGAEEGFGATTRDLFVTCRSIPEEIEGEGKGREGSIVKVEVQTTDEGLDEVTVTNR